MFNGRAKLADGRTLTKSGTFRELADWAKDLAPLFGTVEVTITEVK